MSSPGQEEGKPIESVEQLLAHALAMETEAVERYNELADQMEVHNNPDVAQLFRKLAEIEQLHVHNVTELSEGVELPHIAPWDYAWETPESPESPSPSAREVHYLMQPYHAIALALKHERLGVEFYEKLASQSDREDVRKLASELRETEVEHVSLLEKWLARFEAPAKGWNEDPDPPLLQE
ncbi:MAG TPA: ferritin family protein [Azoarcus taiwanensis]|uniref:Rubrerythrin n=1 Tax=Azoarcus taiwanensis TaxID=666964 RepID=A0A972FBR4_9RHOO|nr:ferritin family protein [Azoarcus taiwanensis]NMG02327.1 rubrerythrin [Azoarcus taiwanensis]HRQ55847.1 ferritin family protein [Azoarcus taiwanensis]